MATQPDIPPPDVIEPQSPPEVPVFDPPSEEPGRDLPESEPLAPDLDQPGIGPDEVPQEI